MNDFLFGNRNQPIVKKLAYRSLKADKHRNQLIIATMVFTTVLLSALCFYFSAQGLKLEERINNHYQAGCTEITQDLIDSLTEMPEIKQWGISKAMGLVRHQDMVLSVLYEDDNQIKLANRPAIEGKLPQAENEIMVERAFLQYIGLSETINQTIMLDLGNGTKQEYRITGIMKRENSSRSFMVFSSKAYVVSHSTGTPVFEFQFRITSGNDEDINGLKSQIKDFLIKNGVPEEKIFYSSNYFDMANLRTSGRTMLYTTGLLLVVACGLVIYSLFYISVAGKVQMYGKLKVIGTTQKQLKSIVRRETMVLLLYSVPIGILLSGIGLYMWMPAYWNWKQNLQSSIGVAIVMLFAVVISTRVPIQMAGRVSPIEAVRITPYPDANRKKISVRPYRRITPFSLARMSFGRNRKKSMCTFASLGLTAIMLMCVTTYAISLDVNSMAASQLSGSNYQLTLSFDDMEEEQTLLKENPLNESLYQSLNSLEGVDQIARYNSSYIQVKFPKQPSEIALTGLTEEQLEEFFGDDFATEETADYSAMSKCNGVIINDNGKLLEKLFGYSPKVGDVLHGSGFGGERLDLHIVGIPKNAHKHIPGGSLLYVTDDTLKNFYASTNNFNTLWHIYTDSNSNALRKEIFTVVTDSRIDILSQQDIADRLRASADSTIKGAYMLVAFLFVFGLINLTNTLMTNLLARQQELSVLQSIGMSFKQMSVMLTAECLWYVVITLIIAVAIGVPAGMLLCWALNQIGVFGTLTYHFPWAGVSVFAVLLLSIQYCFSVASVRYQKKRPVLEGLKGA